MANSFGPWLPRPLWLWLRSTFLDSSTLTDTPYLLDPRWHDRIDNSRRPGRDFRPAKDSYRLRFDLMGTFDYGTFRKGSLAGWGVDERDPTADRKLIEFCLSLPHDQLLRNGITRPLARSALSDRLPQAILNDAPRGYQNAGWFEHVSVADMRKRADLIENSHGADIINVARVRDMIDAWPQSDQNSPKVVEEYRLTLLQALSLGHFIGTFSCGR
jgi:asparagine synthase (glutamine-hydrolysing)